MKTIDDLVILEAVPPKANPNDWAAIDLEIYGGIKGKLHRPIGEFASLAVTYDGRTAFVITDLDKLEATMDALEDATIVAQNAAFDVQQLRRWVDFPARDKFWDTMLVERILYNGLYDEFNLPALVRRHLGFYMEKGTVEEFQEAKEMSREMIRYNAIDTIGTWLVAQKQRELCKASHLRVWNDVDLPALWAFLDFKGPKLDAERWMQIAKENEMRAAELKGGFPFNPNAPAQVKSYFNQTLKLKIPDTNAETLERHAKKHSMVKDLLDYRHFDKRRSTYGENWITSYVESDGRVYPSYDVSRAETGRVAANNPNIQNIPVRDSPVYRECFVASEGHTLVGGDYAQQEIRVGAYLSQDEALIELLRSGRDIYSDIASLIHGREITKKDPERQAAKSVVLGAIYGLSVYGLSMDLGISDEEAGDLMNTFFGRFPDLYRWMGKQQKSEKYVKTAYGRRCWLNPYNSQSLRNALNSPCQGGAADMVKIATGLFHKRWNTLIEPFPVILQVHDEIDTEVWETNIDYTKDLLHRCMIEAGEMVIPGVPVVVDIKIGKNWSQIH